MANIPPADAVIKPTTIVLNCPFLPMPIRRDFCPVELSAYLEWGWYRVEPVIDGCIQLTRPNTQFRMVS